MSDRQRLTPPQTTMWPSPPSLSLSTSSDVSPAAMVVLAQSAVFRQVEAELPKLGALVGEKPVERVVEHRRYQPPHDQTSLDSVSDRANYRNAPLPRRSAAVAAASVASRFCFRRHRREQVIGARSTGRCA